MDICGRHPLPLPLVGHGAKSCPRPIDRSRAIRVIPAAELAERAASSQPIQEIVNQLSSGVGEPNDLPSNSLKGDCRSNKLWSWRTE
ncbi:uncharacterized protein G2W53_029180 [Senna tora]|uniref:Uncharacterized protein n=1 Tax=Senna tora TaxID=362788 RepID=A0A834WDH0_9FABA|nr:uncharacterized protein G2W53_029180 [Senna tora]